MVASLQGRRYILRRQKQSPKTARNLRGRFAEVSLQISVYFGKAIAFQFGIVVWTVKDLLARELGLLKFTLRWVPHSLSERQKSEWIPQSRSLLDLLQRRQTADFNGTATGDESWFQYVYPARTMYARSRSDITTCVRSGICTSNVMITVFYWNAALGSEGCTKGQEI
jgi:hypothetical protein